MNDTRKIYATQWRAYYKNGLMNTSIVYGESEDEAKKNALALYRKNQTAVDFFPIEKVVERVELA